MKATNALKTIGEVSKEISVPVYVIRFWEKKFQKLKPIKKLNGMRYYDEGQIALLKTIKSLLYKKKFSIDGAKAVLENELNDSKEISELISEIKNTIDDIQKYL
tara:strand:+ start:347 stop:658 length:312 start_codon:yes stop_codon:yes gene_type:complete